MNQERSQEDARAAPAGRQQPGPGDGAADAAIEHAINGLGRQDPASRVAAAEAIGALVWRLRDRAVPKIIGLLTDLDPLVRCAAADALGSIGRRAEIDCLAAALGHDSDPTVRASAAEALGAIGHALAISVLRRSLLGDAEAYVRGYAAESLGEIGGEDAVESLGFALETERAPRARICVLGALVRLGRCEALGEILSIAEGADFQISSVSLSVLDRCIEIAPECFYSVGGPVRRTLEEIARRQVLLLGHVETVKARLASGLSGK